MQDSVKRMMIRAAVLLSIAALVYEARHYVLSVHPQAGANVQRVTLLDQPKPVPPTPPPAEVKPQEPSPSDVKPQFFKFDDYGPGDNSPPAPQNQRTRGAGPAGPSDDLLGLDTEGGAGSDSFGLVGKRGGQDITTIGSASFGGGPGGPRGQGQGGPMAKYAGYAAMLKDAITEELNSHANLRVANYDAIVMVWLDPDGRIKRVSLSKSTGIVKMDEDLHSALVMTPKLIQPPPPDMPQPIDLRILSQGATTETPAERASSPATSTGK